MSAADPWTAQRHDGPATAAPDSAACQLLLVSGSQRRDSYNTRLLRHVAQGLPPNCQIDVLEPAQVELPLFDQDRESDARMMQHVAALHRRFEAAHGFVIASPEYNIMPTPYLKNLVDWVSRLPHVDPRFANPFSDRPLLLCSASTGWSGGALGLPHARALFGYLGCVVIGSAVCVPHAEQVWADDAYRFDPFFQCHIDAATGQLVRLACAVAGQRAPHREAA